MQVTVEYKDSRSLVRDLSYKVGNGKNRSLSFYMLSSSLKVSVLKDYLFISIRKRADLENGGFILEHEYNSSSSKYMMADDVYFDVIHRDIYKFYNIFDLDVNEKNRMFRINEHVFNLYSSNSNSIRSISDLNKSVIPNNRDIYKMKDQMNLNRESKEGTIDYEDDVNFSIDSKGVQDEKITMVRDGEGKEIFTKEDVVLDTYTNGLFEYSLESSLYRHDPNIHVIENISVGDQGGNEAMVNEDKRFSTETDSVGSINNGIMVSGKDKYLYYKEELMLDGEDNLLNGYITDFMINSEDNLLNIPENDSSAYIYDDELILNPYLLSISESDNKLNMDDYNKYLKQNTPGLHLFEEQYTLTKGQNDTNVYKSEISLSNSVKHILFDTKATEFTKKYHNSQMVYDNVFLFHPDPELIINKKNMFVCTDKMKGYQASAEILENIYMKMNDKVISSQITDLLLYKDFHGAFLNNKSVFLAIINRDKLFIIKNESVNLNDKIANLSLNNIFIEINNKDTILGLDTSLSLYKDSARTNYSYSGILISKYYHGFRNSDKLKNFIVKKRTLRVNEEFKMLDKELRNLYIQKEHELVHRDWQTGGAMSFINLIIRADAAYKETHPNDTAMDIEVEKRHTRMSSETKVFSKISRDIYEYEIVKIDYQQRQITEYDNTLWFDKYNYNINNYNDYIFTSVINRDLEVIDDYKTITKGTKDIIKNDFGSFAGRYSNETNISNQYMSMHKQSNNVEVINSASISLERYSKNIIIDKDGMMLEHIKRDTLINEYYKFADKLIKDGGNLFFGEDVWAGFRQKEITDGFLFNINLDKSESNILISGTEAFGEVTSRELGIVDNFLTFINSNRDIFFHEDSKWFSRTSKDICVIETWINVGKNLTKTFINNYEDIFLASGYRDFQINNSKDVSITKTDRNIRTDETHIWWKLAERQAFLQDDMVLIKKGYRPGFMNSTEVWSSPNRREVSSTIDYFMGVTKHAEPIYINDSWYYISKNLINFGMDSNDGILISKNRKDTGINDAYVSFTKNMKPVLFINSYNDIFFELGRKNTSLDMDNTLVSKNRKDTGLLYEFSWITKGKKDSSMNYDSFINISKNRKATGIIDDYTWILKNSKAISADESLLLASKNPKLIMTYNTYFGIKGNSKGISIDEFIGQISKGNKASRFDNYDVYVKLDASDIYMNDDKILLSSGSKSSGGGLLNDGSISISTNTKNSNISDNISVNGSFGNLDIEDFIEVSDTMSKFFIEDNLFFNEYISNMKIHDYELVDKNMQNLNPQENLLVNKPMSDMHMEYENIFTTVIPFDGIEKPDELDASGPIDELILPASDFKYKKYISKLINEDGSINLAYVKSFDPELGEYTVRVPLEHPLQMYADVAREYIDVKVELLEQVIYMISQIWKEDMFKYAAMSAQDSLKKLMGQLMEQMKKSYASRPQLMKEAFRCLQLFRWYSEMAVLNNCDYLLKFKTKKVTVDYFNYDLKEFANFTTFENMGITSSGIIEQIDASKNCKVIFTNNQKNPGPPFNISFKLYNINCNSSISIIDGSSVKQSNYKTGIHEINIEVKDRAEIEFIRDDKYQNMAIAALTVNNYQTTDYTIRYKGKYGETNKVMQDLLDRMLVVGEASQELKEKLGDITPVTVAIDTLLKYFELHHQDKSKGRRLITKK